MNLIQLSRLVAVTAMFSLCFPMSSSAAEPAAAEPPPNTARPAPLVNVLTLGAKGDGVADDTEAFQKAIDSLEKTGGVVFVPAGDYRITKTLLVGGSHNVPSKPTDSIEIRGESQMASRLLGDGVEYLLAAKTILNEKQKRECIFGVVLNRLTLRSYSSEPAKWCGGMDVSYMIRWSVRHSIFIGLKTGIYSLSRDKMDEEAVPDSMAVYIIRIQNSVFYGCSDYGIKLGRIFDVVIENNEIEHGTGGIAIGMPGDGFDAAANTIRIENNVIEGLGPDAPAIKGSCWIGARIVGNYFEANRGGDIELTPSGSDGWVRGLTIASNTFQPTAEQMAAGYGPIKLTRTMDAVITANFSTSAYLLHPASGPLGKGINLFSNTLNNPIAIGDIKGAKPGNPSDYIGKLANLSVQDAERISVNSPVASVGLSSLHGFQYVPAGESPRAISYGTSPPTAGDVRHESGDIVFHLKPQVVRKNLQIGWVCIEGGSPGVWKPILSATE